MPRSLRLAIVVIALLIGEGALAQEPKGGLGVEVRDITKAEADKLGWDRGALVAKVPAKGSPAERSGLAVGDLIIVVERSAIETASDFNAAVEARRPGGEIHLQVISGGRQRRITLTLAEVPSAQHAGAKAAPHARHWWAYGYDQ